MGLLDMNQAPQMPQQPMQGGLLGGGGNIVEADETFYGQIKGRDVKAGYGDHKHKIVSLVSRNGETRSFHIANVDGKTLKPILQAQIAKDSKLFTDTAGHYRHMPKGTFQSHKMVNHTQKEYARGEVHTNTVEGYFGLLKRGLNGTYHHVSEAHLQRYVNEFDFRYTHRTSQGVTDHERTNAALRQITGKRLTYRRVSARSQDQA